MSAHGEAAARVFDRGLLRLRRARAAARGDRVTFLCDEVAQRLAERLGDFRRTFPVVLDLGCGNGALGRLLPRHLGVERLLSADLGTIPHAAPPGLSLVADEEMLPFAAESLDAVVSVMALHWVNDLPGTLAQIRWSLKPDGLFLAAFPGGDTLHELRGALLRAELEVTGGASPRVSPFVDLRDAAALLQRAGKLGADTRARAIWIEEGRGDLDAAWAEVDGPLNSFLFTPARIGAGPIQADLVRRHLGQSIAVVGHPPEHGLDPLAARIGDRYAERGVGADLVIGDAQCAGWLLDIEEQVEGAAGIAVAPVLRGPLAPLQGRGA